MLNKHWIASTILWLRQIGDHEGAMRLMLVTCDAGVGGVK